MATVFERPVSALTMPRQRRTPVADVEIIDVDQLDDVPGTSREVIVIDSDDESAPQPGRTRAASRRRLFSPPPPAAAPAPPPPVPPLPHRFAVLASFPTNARTPPVIRPIERNFDLVRPSAVPAHPNRHRRPHIAEPHHIGLGGAIIAFNDQGPRLNNNRDRNRRYLRNHIPNNDEQHGLIGRGFNALRRLYTTLARASPANGDGDRDAADADDDEFNFTFEPLNAAAAAAAEPGGFVYQNPLLLQRRRPEEDRYKPEYTHPDPPQPGYTHNFAPPEPGPKPAARVVIDLADSDSDSEDGPVASTSASASAAPRKRASPSPPAAVRELLVCARCLDPLVLGGALVGDEGRRRRVWALRCGHLIDGQCLDVVGVPEEGHGLGNGKGKGKARACDADDTVRARLRARSRAPVPPVPGVLGTTTVLGKRRRGARARVDATYEWRCPVEGCGRVHASVRVGGVWAPEPDRPRAGARGRKKAGPLLPFAGNGGGGGGGGGDPGGVTPGRGAVAVFV